MSKPSRHELERCLAKWAGVELFHAVKRIMKRISVDSAGCWLWLGACRNGGYGVISIKDKLQAVHRVMYQAKHGIIPEGCVIDHLCRARNCVNPEHLEAVANKENLARGLNQSKKKRCPKWHDYSQENIVYEPHRKCRTCLKEWRKKQDEKPHRKVLASERYYANREKRLEQMRAYDKKRKEAKSAVWEMDQQQTKEGL